MTGNPTKSRRSAVDNRRTGLDGRGREIEAERSQTGAGVTNDDKAGKTVAERIKAATAGLFAADEGVGRRLRGIANDVWHYATDVMFNSPARLSDLKSIFQ
jgi:hypothetical protein